MVDDQRFEFPSGGVDGDAGGIGRSFERGIDECELLEVFQVEDGGREGILRGGKRGTLRSKGGQRTILLLLTLSSFRFLSSLIAAGISVNWLWPARTHQHPSADTVDGYSRSANTTRFVTWNNALGKLPSISTGTPNPPASSRARPKLTTSTRCYSVSTAHRRDYRPSTSPLPPGSTSHLGFGTMRPRPSAF